MNWKQRLQRKLYGRNVYFQCPFTEEEQGDELNEKVKGLFESMSNDENKHVVTSVKVVNKNFSVNFESRDSVHAALKGYFEPLMLNNRKLGPVREGLPPRNVPAIKKENNKTQITITTITTIGIKNEHQEVTIKEDVVKNVGVVCVCSVPVPKFVCGNKKKHTEGVLRLYIFRKINFLKKNIFLFFENTKEK